MSTSQPEGVASVNTNYSKTAPVLPSLPQLRRSERLKSINPQESVKIERMFRKSNVRSTIPTRSEMSPRRSERLQSIDSREGVKIKKKKPRKSGAKCASPVQWDEASCLVARNLHSTLRKRSAGDDANSSVEAARRISGKCRRVQISRVLRVRRIKKTSARGNPDESPFRKRSLPLLQRLVIECRSLEKPNAESRESTVSRFSVVSSNVGDSSNELLIEDQYTDDERSVEL